MPEVADLWVSLRVITTGFTETLAAAGAEAERSAAQIKMLKTEVGGAATRMTRLATRTDAAASALLRLSAESEGTTAGLASSNGESLRAAELFATLEAAVTTTGDRLAALGASADAAATGLAATSAEARGAATALTETATSATEAGAAVEGASAKSAGLGSSISSGALLGVAALAGIGYESVKMATTFQSSTTRLVTSAGESVKNIGMVRNGLLDMAGQVGVSADDLANSLYYVEAAGYKAGDGLTVLKAAAQGAAAEGADTTTVAKALTDVLVDYHLKASDAANVTSQMITAVAHGKTNLQEFSGAFASIVPAASAAGISYQDVTAALAEMTNHGFAATRASQNLAQALRSMLNPTSTMKKAFDEYGVSGDVLKEKLAGPNGLTDAMQYVSLAATKAGPEGTTQFAAALKLLIGTAPGANAALATVGANYQATADTIAAVGSSTADASGKVMGFALVQQTLGQQLRQVRDGFDAVMIRIGDFLIPYISKSITAIESLGGRAVKTMSDLWDIYGPTIKDKLTAASSAVATGSKALLTPLKTGLTDLAVTEIPIAIKGFDKFRDKLTEVGNDAKPAIKGLRDMYDSATSSGGALDTLTNRLRMGADAVGGVVMGLGSLTSLLRPLGQIVGGLASAFSGLSGPMQLSVIWMLAMRPFRSQIQEMQDSVVGFGRAGVSAFKNMGDSILYQRVLAAGAGKDLGVFGGAMAALETHSPVIASMGTSFRTTASNIEAAGGKMVGFRSTVGGVASAIGTGAGAGLMGGLKGLWGFLGGPWGVAISGAMMGLDMLAQKQQQAAAAAEAHRQRITSLASALRDSHGVMDEAVRATAAQTIADTKLADKKTQLLDVLGRAGITLNDVTNAYLGQGDTIDGLRTRLLALADANQMKIKSDVGVGNVMTVTGGQYKAAADALGGMNGESTKAADLAHQLSDAVTANGTAAETATTPVGKLKGFIKTLADNLSTADDKTNALHQSLQLLSGGTLDVQAAVALQNTSITDLNNTWKDAVDQTKGYGAALLNVDGSLNTTSENGQQLFSKLQSLRDQTADTAKATYDFARANHDTVPDALKKAEGAMQTSWEAAVTTAEKLGLTTDQAQALAAQLGLLPSNLPITLGLQDLNPTQASLLYVQGLADHLKQGATVKVGAITADALSKLNDIGIKTETLPDGTVQVTVPDQQVMDTLNAIIDKQIPDKYFSVIPLGPGAGQSQLNGNADGGIIKRFADGGILGAANGATVPGYAPRQDTVLSLLSPGEGVLVPEAVRAIGGERAITSMNRSARSGTSGMAMGMAAFAAAPSGGGGTTVIHHHHTYHVHGSVIAERELQGIVETQQFRIGANNSQTWPSYQRR